ncbi:MAG: Fur family transcriptional regulator [Anaerolineaceae bacterium]|nr:Fur family transcriptional regulator [Anaerolineaceae bacterium]
MVFAHQDFPQLLHQAGLRVTPQRLAICELLVNTETHPTATDIFVNLREQYPSISLATIYNTLDVLVGMGAVNALGSIGDDKVHFDGNTNPHINLACIKCHKIVDLHLSEIDHLNTEINKSSGYKLLGSRVLYYGICPDCQKLV